MILKLTFWGVLGVFIVHKSIPGYQSISKLRFVAHWIHINQVFIYRPQYDVAIGGALGDMQCRLGHLAHQLSSHLYKSTRKIRKQSDKNLWSLNPQKLWQIPMFSLFWGSWGLYMHMSIPGVPKCQPAKENLITVETHVQEVNTIKN